MTPRLMRFVATFARNARRTFSVLTCTISRQIIIVQMKRPETRGDGKKNRNEIRGGDMKGRESSTPGRPNKILFFSNEKERKLCKKRKRKRARGGEGGWCLTFFKGIINSLSALVHLHSFFFLFNRHPDLATISPFYFVYCYITASHYGIEKGIGPGDRSWYVVVSIKNYFLITHVF